MVRNSKFSLPSFGRGRSNTAETDDSVNIKHLNSMTSVRSMHDPNQSKAEQLLGPSETGGGMNQSRGARCLGMIRLKKQPSAMTIGNDEMNYGGTKGYKHHNEQRPDASSPTIRPGQSVSLLSLHQLGKLSAEVTLQYPRGGLLLWIHTASLGTDQI
jgi:hypothetical protein